MANPIQQFYLGNTRENCIANLPKMAELLGFNWNETDSIMYKGDDSTSGFKFTPTSSNSLDMHLYYEGISKFYIQSLVCGKGIYLFYYKYIDGNVIFGFNPTVATFTSAYVMAQNIEDNNINDYVYITTYTDGTDVKRGWVACPSLEINNSLPTQYFNPSFSIITLTPFVFKANNVGYFNIPKLYNIFTKSNMLSSESLILNKEQYYTSTVDNSARPHMPFAFKIEG